MINSIKDLNLSFSQMALLRVKHIFKNRQDIKNEMTDRYMSDMDSIDIWRSHESRWTWEIKALTSGFIAAIAGIKENGRNLRFKNKHFRVGFCHSTIIIHCIHLLYIQKSFLLFFNPNTTQCALNDWMSCMSINISTSKLKVEKVWLKSFFVFFLEFTSISMTIFQCVIRPAWHWNIVI